MKKRQVLEKVAYDLLKEKQKLFNKPGILLRKKTLFGKPEYVRVCSGTNNKLNDIFLADHYINQNSAAFRTVLPVLSNDKLMHEYLQSTMKKKKSA